MRTRSRIITIVLLSALAVAIITVPAVAGRGRRDGLGRGCRGMGRGMGPSFTEEQLEQIEKIHDRFADERAELTNRLKVLGLEAHEILEADEPDFDAIEDKLEEMSAARLELVKMRIRIHKEIRPLLDEDQRVLFDRGFGRILGRGGYGGHGWAQGHPGGRPGHMMGRGAGPGGMMGGMTRGRMMGQGGGAPQPGGSGAWCLGAPGDGFQPGPWCPFAGDDSDE